MATRILEVKRGLLELTPQDIEYGEGKAIWIRVKGFKGNPEDAEEERTQIVLEFYRGKLQIHTWSGEQEDPKTIQINPRPEYKRVMESSLEDLPLLAGQIKDPDAIELLERRLKDQEGLSSDSCQWTEGEIHDQNH